MNFGTALAKKKQQETCPHPSMVTVQTRGVKRQICEDCDHVSFAFLDGLLTEVERDRFARPVDQLVAAKG